MIRPGPLLPVILSLIRKRFIQNVEAIDTVISDLLINLAVVEDVENEWPYIPDSRTIVFFLGDNGTDGKVSSHGLTRAKNSTFEGGIRVPLFVMGEGVPGNTQNPIEDTRLINHVDFFDTIADIVGASPSERDNEYGRFPRRGASFAYNIGWSDRPRADQ